MSSTSRMFTRQSFSALRTLARRGNNQRAVAIRRGYASAHGTAQKSSDMPWAISAGVVTAAGLAYLMSGRSGASAAGHSPTEHPPAEHHQEKEEGGTGGSGSGSGSSKGGAADPNASEKASQSGQNVPPPSGDNSDTAAKWDEKKRDHEDFKETTRAGETKAATSSSSMPSKKTASEDPREDPQKGEGEATQKGSSRD